MVASEIIYTQGEVVAAVDTALSDLQGKLDYQKKPYANDLTSGDQNSRPKFETVE